MAEQQFQEGEIVRYVVEGPIFALLQAEDGVGVALGTHPGECMVISGRNLKFIQRGPDPRDTEIEKLRERDARIHEELRDRRTDDLNVRGHLSPQPGTGPEPCVPFELGPTIAPAVEWLVIEVDRLRAAVPSWADLCDLLVAQRDIATDVELTNAVMALITGADDE